MVGVVAPAQRAVGGSPIARPLFKLQEQPIIRKLKLAELREQPARLALSVGEALGRGRMRAAAERLGVA